MKITSISYSLSRHFNSLNDFEEDLISELEFNINDEADVILYPELFLLKLTDFFKQETLLKQFELISGYLNDKLLPALHSIFKNREILVCLGSGPRYINGLFFNSSPIWINNKWHFQDKLHLTPWEKDFSPGTDLFLFNHLGLKCAILICLDIEQPSLSLKLKEESVNLLLVPSATNNMNGSNRISRCASCRSVELGAAVLISPLIGDSCCDYIDHNEGRQTFFLPSQDIIDIPSEKYSEYTTRQHQSINYIVDVEKLKNLRVLSNETKPFLIPDNLKIRLRTNG